MEQERRGLSPALYRELREGLLRCDAFNTQPALTTVFVDRRISAWKDAIREADTKETRVKQTIDTLLAKEDADHYNALALFLHVLRDQIHPTDALHQKLHDLAQRVEEETRWRVIVVRKSPWWIWLGCLIVGGLLGGGGLWWFEFQHPPASETIEAPALVGLRYEVEGYNPRLVDLRTVGEDGIPVGEGQKLRLFDFTVILPAAASDLNVQVEVYAGDEKIGNSGEAGRQGQVVQLEAVLIERYPYDSDQNAWRVQPGWKFLTVAVVPYRNGKPLTNATTRTWIRLNPAGSSWFVDPPNSGFVSIVYAVDNGTPALLDLRTNAGLAAQPGDVITFPEIWYRANAASDAQMFIEIFYGKTGELISNTYQAWVIHGIKEGTHLFEATSPLSSTVPDDADSLIMWLVREGMVLDELTLPLHGSRSAALIPRSAAILWPFDRSTLVDFEEEAVPDTWAADRAQLSYTTAQALSGRQSLQVTSLITEAAPHQTFARWQQEFTADLIVVHYYLPSKPAVHVEYLQFCAIHNSEWRCDCGNSTVYRQSRDRWETTMMDLSQCLDSQGAPLSQQDLTAFAVQGVVQTRGTTTPTTFTLYLDALQFFADDVH